MTIEIHPWQSASPQMAPMLADQDRAIFRHFPECACQQPFAAWFFVFVPAFHLRASAPSAVKIFPSPT